MTEKTIVIDAANHLVGRLASVVAKQLLSGKKIVVVRCDLLCKSGKFVRSVGVYKDYLRKRTNTNPQHGPFHHRAPCMMFHKAVRGMLPIRTERGKEALKQLHVFDGVPNKFAKVKRVQVPGANRHVCLKPVSQFCRLDRLASEFGWGYNTIVKKLEEKRKVRSGEYHQQQVKKAKARRAAVEKLSGRLKNIDAQLKKLGYLY